MRLVLVVLGMNQVGSGNSLVEAIWWMKYLGNTQHLNNGLIGHKKDSSLLSKIYWLYRGYEFEPNRVVRSVVSWGEQWQTKLWPHTDSNLSYTIHTSVWKFCKKSHEMVKHSLHNLGILNFPALFLTCKKCGKFKYLESCNATFFEIFNRWIFVSFPSEFKEIVFNLNFSIV